MNVCWIDGRPADSLPVSDRGLHYGDGLFETLPVRDGRIPLLDAHLERLREGCGRLGFIATADEVLRGELRHAADGQARAVLKLMVTRGSGGRGYRPPDNPAPTRLLLRYPWPDHPASWQDHGVSLRVCTTRLGIHPELAGLKHLNRLEQVLARAEWGDSGEIQEGLMLDGEGAVVEGTMTNVFAVTPEGVLVTPDMNRAGVYGVMRRHILEQADKAGTPTRVRRLPFAELLGMRELFVCNSIIGVWPVVRLGEHRYEIGPVTRRAQGWAMQA
ncbi:MAG TPA: aminodeoxychorismate lyase [Gammaproteobacteria bacterium]|nr:aminodeoxychorismate lyase [Gammaproteobacteria bacterium]